MAIAAHTLAPKHTIEFDEPDHKHDCGCVTFTHNFTKLPPTVYYRQTCSTHKHYVTRLGLLSTNVTQAGKATNG